MFGGHGAMERTAARGVGISALVASLLAGVALLALSLASAAPAWAASSRYVAQPPLGSDANGNLCTDAAHPCATLSHAVSVAGAGDTINVAASSTPYSDHVTIGTDLTLSGSATASTIIDGGNNGIVFNLVGGSQTLTHLTIQNGAGTEGAAGGIFNQGGGTLTLTDVTLRNNTSTSSGGGIDNFPGGTLILTNVLLTGNTAPSQYGIGGGIDNEGATATLTNVVFSHNSAASGGGGLFNAGTLTLTNVTFVDNSAGVGGGIESIGTTTLTNATFVGNSAGSGGIGGGIYNTSGAMATLTNVTLSGNSAGYSGGGIYNLTAGGLKLRASVLAGNSGGACNATPPTSQGYNIAGDTSCSLSGPGDLQNTDPKLGTLADNNGPSVGAPGATMVLQTQALLPGSPAIGHVSPSVCPPPATDERGVTRPQGTACDAGAYQASDTTPPTLACSANPASIWPPNHKLVSVTTSVSVSDSLSDPTASCLSRPLPAAAPAISRVHGRAGEHERAGEGQQG